MEQGKVHNIHHVVTAGDVTAGLINVGSDMLAPQGAIVGCRDAAGALKSWGGTITVASGIVTLTNTGTVDFAATDVLDIAITS